MQAYILLSTGLKNPRENGTNASRQQAFFAPKIHAQKLLSIVTPVFWQWLRGVACSNAASRFFLSVLNPLCRCHPIHWVAHTNKRGHIMKVTFTIQDISSIHHESKIDHLTLDQLENVVRQGAQAFARVGAALQEIRDRQLFKKLGYSSFHNYVKDRFPELGRVRALQYVEAVEGLKGLPEGAEPNESQSRALAKIPEQHRAAEWEKLTNNPSKLTAAAIRKAADKYQSPEEQVLAALFRGEKTFAQLLEALNQRPEETWGIYDLCLLLERMCDESKIHLARAADRHDALRFSSLNIPSRITNLNEAILWCIANSDENEISFSGLALSIPFLLHADSAMEQEAEIMEILKRLKAQKQIKVETFGREVTIQFMPESELPPEPGEIADEVAKTDKTDNDYLESASQAFDCDENQENLIPSDTVVSLHRFKYLLPQILRQIKGFQYTAWTSIAETIDAPPHEVATIIRALCEEPILKEDAHGEIIYSSLGLHIESLFDNAEQVELLQAENEQLKALLEKSRAEVEASALSTNQIQD